MRVLLPSRTFPARTRPLRTGDSFLIVLPPRQRIVAETWDKLDYQPAEACELIVQGENLAVAPLALQIETLDGQGGWQPAGEVEAKPNAGGTGARAAWQFPPVPGVPNGALLRARWKAEAEEPGVESKLLVEGFELDGAQVIWTVERADECGVWIEQRSWSGVLEDGKAEATFRIPALDQAEAGLAGFLVEARIEDASPSRLSLLARAERLDGSAVEFVLEQEVEGGFVECSRDSATFRSGAARVRIDLPGRAAHEEPPREAVFEQPPGALLLRAPGHDGEVATFALERLEDGLWQTVGAAEEAIESGAARAEIEWTGEEVEESRLVEASIEDLSAGGASLLARSFSLEGKELEFVLEKAGDDGWQEVSSSRATVQEGMARQRVEFTANDPAALLDAQFDGEELVATATGLDGVRAQFTLERCDDGEWTAVGTHSAAFENGSARVPAGAAASASGVGLLVAQVEEVGEDEARLLARAEGLDGQKLEFVLEREEGGAWLEEGSAAAPVMNGEARASIELRRPPRGALLEATFAELDSRGARLAAHGADLDGEKVEFVVERLQDGAWVWHAAKPSTMTRGSAEACLHWTKSS